jgi:superfamily II DNA or RNA helicase
MFSIARGPGEVFPAHIIARGEEYAAQGLVRLTLAEPSVIQAVVTGSSAYDVTLLAHRGEVLMACTCPYAADGDACKHMWAVIRQASDTGVLAPFEASAGPDPRFIVQRTSDLARIARQQEELAARVYPPRVEPARAARAPRSARQEPAWRKLLRSARDEMQDEPEPPGPTRWPDNVRLAYIVDLASSWSPDSIIVEVAIEIRKANGRWGAPVHFEASEHDWLSVPDPADRQIAQMLIGAKARGYYERSPGELFELGHAAFDTTLAAMCATGRCRVRLHANKAPGESVQWDSGEPWRLALRVDRTPTGQCMLRGVLTRADQEMPLSAPKAVHASGLLYVDRTLACFEHGGAFSIARTLHTVPEVPLAEGELPELIETLYSLPRRPPIKLPDDMAVRDETTPPQPVLSIGQTAARSPYGSAYPRLALQFRYGTATVTSSSPETTVFDRDSLALRHRDFDAELAATNHLLELGAREAWDPARQTRGYTISPKQLGALVAQVMHEGWRVESSGRRYRTAGSTRASVRSGIDWFDLQVAVDYGGVTASMPELLAALQRGDTTVTLSDGSVGLLPTEWLRSLGPAIAAGVVQGDATRFGRSQVALLDALLAAMPEADADEAFDRARAEMASFAGIGPMDPADSFVGTLREYQRDGLGWLNFLRRFSLGGCLADDMGLGKTVQVLAQLDAVHAELRASRQGAEGGAAHEKPRPSIIVVPRSLVFNWLREAARFAPTLRVLDFSRTGRKIADIDSAQWDVVITTYGMLRRDIPALSRVPFEYAILDEAQAIKNSSTAAAKAARLLRARHRLALSGTPIENRVQELWSLFEFLNPGMLGRESAFAALARLTDDGGQPDEQGRVLLSRALRPVILRRTKDQVAPELPDRVEQTLFVEMEPAQRKFYTALLEASRQSVLDRVDEVGIARSRMHILEALLRLRQAACAPVLADPTKARLPSAKLDMLLPSLDEVMAEGHKVIVFSQFTSFLAVLRERLDTHSIAYEYLDGRTRDREARVDRFQSPDGPQLFLVSLKAGGHGLNLTAADYVYLLDPWWNPAVEAQAIDRAHRIGQTRRVIATRIVAKGTIEEKVLELQASKRALADAILGADQGGVSHIGRAELEMLLGA